MKSDVENYSWRSKIDDVVSFNSRILDHPNPMGGSSLAVEAALMDKLLRPTQTKVHFYTDEDSFDEFCHFVHGSQCHDFVIVTRSSTGEAYHLFHHKDWPIIDQDVMLLEAIKDHHFSRFDGKLWFAEIWHDRRWTWSWEGDYTW